MFRKCLSVLLAIVMMTGIFTALPVAINAQEVDVVDVGLESTGNSTIDAFINDSRWTNGVSWTGGQAPKISSFKGQDCAAYCADYVKYCYGSNNPRSGEVFYSASETRAGDVITVGNPSDGNGHWFVVLKRSGNSLYVAEGNYAKKVRIGWNYSVSGNGFTGTSYGFTAGYHYLDGNPDPTPDFTPADIGTDFYAFIISMSAWKHLTVDSNVNVTLRSEKPGKSPDQVFKFERQADGSYKIISTANGMCLDVEDASSASCANVGVWYDNNSDAQRWYIYGSSGQYTLRAKCTDCKLDLYGASTADGTNISMYDISHEKAQKFQIWQLEDRPFAADIGDNFTAPILNSKSWITLENNNGNLILNKEVGKSHQLWKFKRNIDGSYTIFSCLDGKCIDLKGFSHADGTNIGVQTANNTDAQRWYIYNNGQYCEIKSKESGKFFDVAGGSLTSGANIQAYTWNGSDYQRFNIYGGEECIIKSPTLKVKVGTSLTETIFSWDNVYGETGYNLKIWKDKIWVGEAYKIVYDADMETKLTLPVGTYQAYVDADNYFDIKMSNTVTFTIEQGVVPTTPPTEPKTIILGDVDGDEEVTIIDATAIQRHLASIPTASYNEKAADADEDGEVTIIDATAIQRHLAQLPSNENIGKPIG